MSPFKEIVNEAIAAHMLSKVMNDEESGAT
jgi:hypothetical protein